MGSFSKNISSLEAYSLVKIIELYNYTKNRTPSNVLSNNGMCSCAVCITILAVAVNSDQFQFLHSCTLLLKPPILVCSWYKYWVLIPVNSNLISGNKDRGTGSPVHRPHPAFHHLQYGKAGWGL